MKRRIRCLFKVLGALFLTFALLVGLLHTPPGRTLLASGMSRLLSRPENVEVHIGSVKGWIPGNMHIDGLTIADGDGVWLTLQNLHARWIMHEMLRGRIKLKRLGADQIEVMRLPRPSSRRAQVRRGRGLDNLEIVLDGLQIGRLELDQAVAGTPLQYGISSGGLSLLGGTVSGLLTVNGDAEGQVDIEADLADPDKPWLNLKADLEALNRPRFSQDRISGYGEARIDSSGVVAQVDVSFVSGEQNGRLTARLHHANQRLELQDFRFFGPEISAEGQLGLDFGKGLVDVGVEATLTDAATNRFAMRGTARVATTNNTWSTELEALNIRAWDVASVTIFGSINAERVDLRGSLADFDIGRLPFGTLSNYTGRIGGRFSMRGPTQQPLVEAGIEVTDFKNAAEALDELPPLDMRISGGVSNGTLYASTSLTNFNNGYLAAEASIPCTLSLSPFIATVDRSGTDMSLESVMDLSVLNRLAIMEDQFVSGVLTVYLVVEDRVPSGFVLLEKGAYEHYDWGLLFRDFNAELEFTSDGILIRKAGATDGHEGRLRMVGGMRDGLIDVSLNLSAAQMVRRPEAKATISGELKLSGPPARPLVKGVLVVDQADILPDNILPPKPELLTSFDVTVPKPEELSAEMKARTPLPFDLDIRVDMPEQVYVNASLIDSIWGGTLRVANSPRGIKVEGRVEPKRGYIDFVGKKFRFQQGAIELDGSIPPEPVLDNLTAEYARGEITARLILNGKFNNPQYRLESTPALPEDEILSQVLFNRDTSSISAYQAFQIAYAAKQLSGGMSGPGFMYQFRRAVGVDTLELREPEEEGGDTEVAAGKYIASGLYVEVSSTFGTEAHTDASLEYEINRHFSIETSTGPSLRPGIGINWKNDY